MQRRLRFASWSGWLAILSLLVAAPAAANSIIDIDWVSVGSPGNAPDDTGYGSVGYVFEIGKYEVTNSQYAAFLNAVATTDPNALYNPAMGTDASGGITREGSPGSYSYSVKEDMNNKPVNYVSFWDSLRFANWLHNGQPTGVPQDESSTEDGAYTITLDAVAANSITRNSGAVFFLTSEDEWYKAAYYNAISTSYFDYPAGADAQTICAAPDSAPNTVNMANCGFAVGTVTDVGSYTGSPSPAGTYDQGGNVWELNEAYITAGLRGRRGGSWSNNASSLAASRRGNYDPTGESALVGFRVAAAIPEPGTGLLVMTGMLGLVMWRRQAA